MALTKAQITQFQERLEQMRNQLTRMLEGTTREVKRPDESTGYSQHQADQGTDDFDRTISLEITGKEFELLRQIERALEKISDQTYGVCDVSGDEIPLARLEAVPYATMTVKSQELFEKGLLTE
ncbi:MAG: General stress protein 16O [Chlamydiales bacterium]|nr:General stress protein 16O [Chlamydiales bacterium]